jgi:hypothetical protein
MSFSLLYDLCAWLGGCHDAVPPDIGYALAELQAVPDPQMRLRAYVARELLSLWELALAPCLGAASRSVPRLKSIGAIAVTGERRGELTFSSLSGSAPESRWVLTVRLTPDLARIETASLRAA